MNLRKISIQIDEKILRDLQEYAKDSDKNLSCIVTEAVTAYLKNVQIRKSFRDAMDEALDDNQALLERLTK